MSTPQPHFKLVAFDNSWMYEKREDGTLKMGMDVEPHAFWDVHLVDVNAPVHYCSAEKLMDLYEIRNVFGWGTREVTDEMAELETEHAHSDPSNQVTMISERDFNKNPNVFNFAGPDDVPEDVRNLPFYGYPSYEALVREYLDAAHDAINTGGINVWINENGNFKYA